MLFFTHSLEQKAFQGHFKCCNSCLKSTSLQCESRIFYLKACSISVNAYFTYLFLKEKPYSLFIILQSKTNALKDFSCFIDSFQIQQIPTLIQFRMMFNVAIHFCKENIKFFDLFIYVSTRHLGIFWLSNIVRMIVNSL